MPFKVGKHFHGDTEQFFRLIKQLRFYCLVDSGSISSWSGKMRGYCKVKKMKFFMIWISYVDYLDRILNEILCPLVLVPWLLNHIMALVETLFQIRQYLCPSKNHGINYPTCSRSINKESKYVLCWIKEKSWPSLPTYLLKSWSKNAPPVLY